MDLKDEILDEQYDHVGEGAFQIKLFVCLAIISAIIFIVSVFLFVLNFNKILTYFIW